MTTPSSSPVDQATLDWYAHHAQAYADATRHLDMRDLRQRFLSKLPAVADILDAGCGSGRDAAAFSQAGHRVTAIDASPDMIAVTRTQFSGDTYVYNFADIPWHERFDGIWTCASLLHLPEHAWAASLAALTNALRTGGVWYMSVKWGPAHRGADGRWFCGQTAHDIEARLAHYPLRLIASWTTQGRRDTDTDWHNVLVQKVPV